MTAPAQSQATANGVPEPISITEFRNDARPITVDWLGREITVLYKPAAMDAEHYKQLREDSDLPMSEWDIKYGLRILAAIPSLCEADGSPLQISEENLRQLPTMLLNKIITAIGDDLFPKEPEKPSNGTSPPTELPG